jgi:hypothetical protein
MPLEFAAGTKEVASFFARCSFIYTLCSQTFWICSKFAFSFLPQCVCTICPA